VHRAISVWRLAFWHIGALAFWMMNNYQLIIYNDCFLQREASNGHTEMRAGAGVNLGSLRKSIKVLAFVR
jgi:hypothetical protein